MSIEVGYLRMPSQYTFTPIKDLEFPSLGETVKMKEGESREFDNPCSLINFINAGLQVNGEALNEEH